MLKKTALTVASVLLACNMYAQSKSLYRGNDNFGFRPTVVLSMEGGYLGTPIASIDNIPEKMRIINPEGVNIHDVWAPNKPVLIEEDKLKSMSLASIMFPPKLSVGVNFKLGNVDLEAMVQRRFVVFPLPVANMLRDNPQEKTYRETCYVKQIVRPKLGYAVELKIPYDDESKFFIGFSIDTYKHLIKKGWERYDGTAGASNSGGTGEVLNKAFIQKYPIGKINDKSLYIGYGLFSGDGRLDDIGQAISIKAGIKQFNYKETGGFDNMKVNVNKLGWFVSFDLGFKI